MELSTQNRWWGYTEIGNPVRCLWEWKMMEPLWKSVLVLRKIKNRITIWASNSISAHIPVLDHSGVFHKMSQAGWFIHHRNLFLTILEDGRATLGSQHGLVLMKALFWVADCRLLAISSHDKGESKLSFRTAQIHSWELCPDVLRPRLLILSHGALGFQHTDFGEAQTFRP